MKNKYLKAGFGYTIGNYLLKGLSFLTMPIFARLLTTAEYGEYGTFLSYEGMLFVVIGFAIHSSYKNAYYRYSNGEDASGYQSYVSSSMLLILGSTVGWLIISLAFNQGLSNLLGITGLYLPFLVLYSFSSAVINCFNTDISIRYEYGKFLLVSFVNAIGSILLSLVLILYVWRDNRCFGRILGCTIPYTLIACILMLTYLRKARPRDMKTQLGWGLRYSLPVIPHGLSQIVLNQFDRIMILRMVDRMSAGIYTFSYNVYLIMTVTATSVDNVWSPWFYERRSRDDYGSIKKMSGYYLLFLMTICFFLTQMSPELIWILGGSKYRESVYCVIPIVTAGFFAFAYNIPAVAEYYHEKTGNIAFATTAAALINIGLNYIFIKRYGYIAAAYTTLVTYILYFAFHLLMSYHIEKRMLFHTKVILGASVLVLANNILVIRLVPYVIVRYAIILLFGLAAICYEEKNMGLIRRRLHKR